MRINIQFGCPAAFWSCAKLFRGLALLGIAGIGCAGFAAPASSAFAAETPGTEEMPSASAPATEAPTGLPISDGPGSEATPEATENPIPTSAPPTPNPEDELAYLDDRVAEITVTPLEGRPGDTIHVTGTCTYRDNPATGAGLSFRPADRELYGAWADVPVDPAAGRIDADVVVPEDATPGRNDLGWMCELDDMVFGWDAEEIVWFTVLEPEPKPTAAPTATVEPTQQAEPASWYSNQLAETGTPDQTIPLITGLSALGGGSLLLLRRASKRQR